MSKKQRKNEDFEYSFGSSIIKDNYDGKKQASKMSLKMSRQNIDALKIKKNSEWIEDTLRELNIPYSEERKDQHTPLNNIESQYLIDYYDDTPIESIKDIDYYKELDYNQRKGLKNRISFDDEDINNLNDKKKQQKHFVRGQVTEQMELYQAWKKKNNYVIEPEDDVLNETVKGYTIPLAEQWWNKSQEKHYEMPHQALHGGVDRNDDESDLPLNTYWHKISLSPDSWHTLKSNYRTGMKPGSALWNELAYRSENERNFISSKYWPESFRIWFQRSEDELLNSHEFRCKMLEHSAIGHYWEIGELRFNRERFKPYVRFGIWFCAPFCALWCFVQYHIKFGVPTLTQYKHEWIRWKHMMKTGEADEYYMLGNRNEMHRQDYMQAIKPRTANANKLTDLEGLKERTMGGYLNNIAEKMTDIPY